MTLTFRRFVVPSTRKLNGDHPYDACTCASRRKGREAGTERRGEIHRHPRIHRRMLMRLHFATIVLLGPIVYNLSLGLWNLSAWKVSCESKRAHQWSSPDNPGEHSRRKVGYKAYRCNHRRDAAVAHLHGQNRSRRDRWSENPVGNRETPRASNEEEIKEIKERKRASDHVA